MSKRMESAKNEHSLLALGADVGIAVTSGERTEDMLQACAEALVNHLPAAFARIWLLSDDEKQLILAATAGVTRNLNGNHSAINVGECKVGQIAATKRAELVNNLNVDELIEPDWFKQEGIVSFAGHPLLVGERVLGVMAIFAGEELDETTLPALSAVADTVSLGIQRKRSEQALQISERRYRAMFETAAQGILTVGSDSKIETINRAGALMFGYSEQELIGTPITSLMPNFVGEEEEPEVSRRLLTGQRQIFGVPREIVGYRKDGSSFPLELALSVANLGPTSIFTAIVRDLTVHTTFREQLRHQHLMFKNFAERVRDVFWVATPNMDKYLYVSPAYEHVWGRPAQELYDDPHSFMELVYEEDRPRVLNTITMASSQPSGLSSEFRIVRPNGDVRWVWVRTFPIIDALGRILQICGITSDFTERKESERRVSEFYSIVSHELRTPLTSIRAALGLVEGGITGSVPPDVMELVQIARTESDRLIRLINDILDIRKIEAGKLEVALVVLDASQIVNDTVSAMQGFAQEYGISLRANSSSEHAFLGERDRVIQVLTNLISNAIKFSPRDSEVRVSSRRNGRDFVRFEVSDSGEGIPEDKISKLFQLFQQLDSSDTRAKGGTGLGLAISKAIVERLNGNIGLDSKVGTGTTFWFDLPAARGAGSLEDSSGSLPALNANQESNAMKSFFTEFLSSLPEWYDELCGWIAQAKAEYDETVLNYALLRVKTIRESAKPCGYGELATKMKTAEKALVQISQQGGSDCQSAWQEIDAVLKDVSSQFHLSRNKK